jgi:hypothetical protein
LVHITARLGQMPCTPVDRSNGKCRRRLGPAGIRKEDPAAIAFEGAADLHRSRLSLHPESRTRPP